MKSNLKILIHYVYIFISFFKKRGGGGLKLMHALKSPKHRESKPAIKWNMHVAKWFKFIFFLEIIWKSSWQDKTKITPKLYSKETISKFIARIIDTKNL